MMPWTTKQLASALDLTSRRVNQLVEGGILPAPTSRGHDPFKAVPAYLRFLSKRLTGGDLKAARIAKYQIETAIKELEWKQKTGELVELRVVCDAGFRATREVRDGVLNVPDRISGILAAESSQAKVHQILTKELTQCLQTLSEHDETLRKRAPQRRAERHPRSRHSRHVDGPRGSA